MQVNGQNMAGYTREEAVLYLMSLTDSVEMTVQHRREEYDRVQAQQVQDNFYIRHVFVC